MQLLNATYRTNRKKKDDNSPMGNSAALGFVLKAAFCWLLCIKRPKKAVYFPHTDFPHLVYPHVDCPDMENRYVDFLK